jgi:hypothetical protein
MQTSRCISIFIPPEHISLPDIYTPPQTFI